MIILVMILIGGCEKPSNRQSLNNHHLMEPIVRSCSEPAGRLENLMQIAMVGGVNERYAKEAESIAMTCANAREKLSKLNYDGPCIGAIQSVEAIAMAMNAVLLGRQTIDDLAYSGLQTGRADETQECWRSVGYSGTDSPSTTKSEQP
ncbi:MAG TPA: hypothetical protein VF559_04090 [Caulobacteraceae bacterium]